MFICCIISNCSECFNCYNSTFLLICIICSVPKWSDPTSFNQLLPRTSQHILAYDRIIWITWHWPAFPDSFQYQSIPDKKWWLVVFWSACPLEPTSTSSNKLLSTFAFPWRASIALSALHHSPLLTISSFSENLKSFRVQWKASTLFHVLFRILDS